jgi:hypothetical protein
LKKVRLEDECYKEVTFQKNSLNKKRACSVVITQDTSTLENPASSASSLKPPSGGFFFTFS